MKMKTVKQIADELKREPQAIRNKIKKLGVKPHTDLNGKTWLIDKKGYDILMKDYLGDLELRFAGGSTSRKVQNERLVDVLENTVEVLKETLARLEFEFDIKTRSISSLEKRLAEAHKIIDKLTNK
jgi:hypothetical protein